MSKYRVTSLLALSSLVPLIGVPVLAQDTGRVSPALLPIPLTGNTPLAPDIVRSRNPNVLPMMGTWQFALTHGKIVAGQFQPAAAASNKITASSNEDKNPPENAFDGDPTTRWCANGDSYPQSLQADMDTVRTVVGVTLNWERPAEKYGYVVEGSLDGKKWKALASLPLTTPGSSEGPIAMTPTKARFVRVTTTGASGPDWASLWECRIDIQDENGKTVAWRPPVLPPPPTPVANNDFAQPEFADSAWDAVAVPSNWEMAGYSRPTYDSVDNSVGQYRRWVTVPKAWTGQRIYWRFDGALDGAEIFVNGKAVGYHESGYTAFDVDLTDFVKPGERNLFAVRLSKSTPSFDCETGDFQCMGGIYRETDLITVPQTHLSDITVRTPLTNNYHDATLNADVKATGTPGATVAVNAALFTIDGKPVGVTMRGTAILAADGTANVSLSAPVTAPKLWSAEKPNLYYVTFTLSEGGKTVETAEQRFGFKQVEVGADHVVLWNGVPVKCTGICRHDFWSDKGFALTDKEWRKDLTMMKAANINAVRTSHYNHAARFLELCDEMGMYILDEVPYCWIGDQVKDPAYAPFLLQRATETVARDKNRACVLAWSLGNENPQGPDSQAALDLVLATDPTRPAFTSGGVPDHEKGEAWEDNHYPGPGSVDRMASNTRWGANFTEHPHTFYEKEAQEYDPGVSDLWSEALIKTWDKLWKAPRILGSFIWEWQSQGIADKFDDHTRDFYFGPDHLRQENNKGIVDGYRNPKAELWIVKMVYSPVVIATDPVTPINGVCGVVLTNHYSFTNLDELTCRWTATVGNGTKTGFVRIACPPMQSIRAEIRVPNDLTALRLDFLRPDGSSVVAANLTTPATATPTPPAALTGGDALTVDRADGVKVHNKLQSLHFDAKTGAITWHVNGKTLLDGLPTLNLGESKTLNERDFLRSSQPLSLSNVSVTVADPATDGSVRATVTGAVMAASSTTSLGNVTITYDIQPNAEIRVGWNLAWTAGEKRLWETGLKLPVSLPGKTMQMAWNRDSYFADYPAGHLGEPTGTCGPDDVLFRAAKRNLHYLTLTGTSGPSLALLSQDNAPLIARALPADKAANGDTRATLFASSEEAGVRGLSGSWVSEHEIHARPGESLTGSFLLRATTPEHSSVK